MKYLLLLAILAGLASCEDGSELTIETEDLPHGKSNAVLIKDFCHYQIDGIPYGFPPSTDEDGDLYCKTQTKK